MNKIAITDTEAALLWTNQVNHEIEETHDLLTECGRTIQAIKDDAEGTLIDELYKYGADFMAFTAKVTGAMKSCSGAIRNVVNGLRNLFSK